MLTGCINDKGGKETWETTNKEAQRMLLERGLWIVLGIVPKSPEELVAASLSGALCRKPEDAIELLLNAVNAMQSIHSEGTGQGVYLSRVDPVFETALLNMEFVMWHYWRDHSKSDAEGYYLLALTYECGIEPFISDNGFPPKFTESDPGFWEMLEIVEKLLRGRAAS